MQPSHLFCSFKPYADPDLQHLSTKCCLLLVTISSVLLRSQTLLSSARTINFDPTEPDQAASTVPVDVQVCIFVILSCLVLPFVWLVKPFEGLLACILLVRQKCSRRPSEQPNQLHQHATDQKSLRDTIQMDTLEGLEMTGLIRRDKAAAGDHVTSEVACDEKRDPKMNRCEGISINQKIAIARGDNCFAFECGRSNAVAAAEPEDPAFTGVGECTATQFGECGHELAQMKAALVWEDALRDLEQIRKFNGNDSGSESLGRGAGNQMNSSRKLKSSASPPPAQSITTQMHPTDGNTLDQC